VHRERKEKIRKEKEKKDETQGGTYARWSPRKVERADPLGPTRHTGYHISRDARALSRSFRERGHERGGEPDDSAGNIRGDLLVELRVLQQQRVLAALELLLLLLLRQRRCRHDRRLLMLLRMVVLMLMLVLMLLMLMMMLLLGDLFRGLGFGALVQHADRTVLADSVRHFRRVDPHGELAGEQAVQDGRQQADVRAGLGNYRIHFTVDAYATIAGAAIWPIREPVVPVTVAQHLRQR